MTRPKMVGGVALLVLALVGSLARGQSPEAPFVAGFERFARHAVVEPNVGGMLLLSELSCTACHATDTVALAPKRGPRLTGVGNRVDPDWMRDFLRNPEKAKPGTTMPDVLAAVPEVEREKAVEALVAFLATQHLPFPEAKASGSNPLPHEFWAKGDADRGQKLYHVVGCVACHEPDSEYQGGHSQPSAMAALLANLDPEDIEAMGLTEAARPVPSVPLPNLAAKYTSQALTFFLAAPETVRPGARMPNLKLSLVEAADLAAYLRKTSSFQGNRDATPGLTAPENVRPEASGLVEQGRALFTSLSCVNCHDLDGLAPTAAAKSLAELSPNRAVSCLGEPSLGLPHFPLDARQKEALTAALRVVGETKPKGSAEASLELSLMQQNCYACHQRGERGGIGPQRERYFETVSHVDLGDEGRLPPPLDHVGYKLTPSGLTKVLEGSGDVRPHMLVRMPKFPKELTERLPAGFAAADQASRQADAEVFSKHQGLEDEGRRLLNNGCVQCHPIRGEAVSGAVGVDLALVTQRVRPQWFLEFLRNPAELKARTRMPSFFPNGQSSIPEILDGNMDHQIAAMWSYLKAVKSQRLPEKIEEARSQEFELMPEDHPILIRTFMEAAGTHAIAVGFPQRVHYAFDADRMRLAQAWRGRFIDAYGTWYVRSAPPAAPLGTDIVLLPAGLPFAQLPSAEAAWPAETEEATQYRFLGYRFDAQGIPTLRYSYRGYEIEDRMEPTHQQGLKRVLSIVGEPRGGSEATLWFQAHRGKNLTLRSTACSELSGITVTLNPRNEDAVLWHDPNDSDVMQWRIPLRSQRPVEVTYQW